MSYSGICLSCYVSLTSKVHLVHHMLLRTLFLSCPCRKDFRWETSLALRAACSWPPFPWELATFSPVPETGQKSGGHNQNNAFGMWLLPSLLQGAAGFAMNHSNSPSWGRMLFRRQGCVLDSICPAGSMAPRRTLYTPLRGVCAHDGHLIHTHIVNPTLQHWLGAYKQTLWARYRTGNV